MQRVLMGIAILAISLAGCAGLPSGSRTDASEQTWLAIHGPRDWIPSEPMSLEIGDAAWSVTPLGGGGVVTPDLAEPARVRLIGVETCRSYASFDVVPGSAWIIRFAPDESVTVEDAAEEARAMGPGLVEGPPSECDPPT